tara:strand:+ start:4708 stop:4926 length:219 start_codon:yes stop_codon:yes gene_type:complete
MNSIDDNIEFIEDMLKAALASVADIADIERLLPEHTDHDLVTMWHHHIEEIVCYSLPGLSVIIEEITEENQG